MTTGDEPMLPQPADDNSPMIGRIVQEKIQADLHGAYLARNLEALIRLMDQPQQARFKKLLIQLAVSHIDHIVEQRGNIEFLNTVVQVAKWWIETEELQMPQDMLDLWRAVGGITGLHFTLWSALCTLLIEPIAESYGASIFISISYSLLDVVSIDLESRRQQLEAARQSMDTWHLDAAWAILHGRQPPPFPELPT
jgi:hypothetical protein